MKRLILQQFTTIDGLVAGPDGQIDFISDYSTKHDQSFEQGAMAFLDTVDTMLLGRRKPTRCSPRIGPRRRVRMPNLQRS